MERFVRIVVCFCFCMLLPLGLSADQNWRDNEDRLLGQVKAERYLAYAHYRLALFSFLSQNNGEYLRHITEAEKAFEKFSPIFDPEPVLAQIWQIAAYARNEEYFLQAAQAVKGDGARYGRLLPLWERYFMWCKVNQKKFDEAMGVAETSAAKGRLYAEIGLYASFAGNQGVAAACETKALAAGFTPEAAPVSWITLAVARLYAGDRAKAQEYLQKGRALISSGGDGAEVPEAERRRRAAEAALVLARYSLVSDAVEVLRGYEGLESAHVWTDLVLYASIRKDTRMLPVVLRKAMEALVLSSRFSGSEQLAAEAACISGALALGGQTLSDADTDRTVRGILENSLDVRYR